MPLTVPARFAHGDFPIAADLNTISDGQTWLNTVLGDGQQPATEKVTGLTVSVVHIWRWAWYLTTSGETVTIVDPSGTQDDTTLADSEGAMAVYDLAQVSWLSQGQVYLVTGADYFSEDFEA